MTYTPQGISFSFPLFRVQISLLGDIYLIPSVCPETFSYTTEEAMTMGLPVACYDLGAPAERVKKYKKGLIISKIDAQTTLKEIEQFFQR